jgi:Zn-dependent M28 family amino/carboxypeptidase
LTGENVLGYVEGSDKQGELVVVTAHYDHIGTMDGEVYNGADDDGSGTVAVLEMAQAFMEAKAQGHGPPAEHAVHDRQWRGKRPVGVRMVHRSPGVPFGQHGGQPQHRHDRAGGQCPMRKPPDYVYVIGSGRISSELKQINEAENAKWTKLQLDYTFDSDSDPNRFYYRSDHYNFAKHGVPIAFYFNGVHADYHGPYDEVEKIRFDLLEKRARLVFHTAWELANRDRRIRPDAPERMGHD